MVKVEITNRIDRLFEGKREQVLSIYFTAGFPGLDDTRRIISELAAAGADMIEIGMPFSDPLADGPVIQHSSEVALHNGMNLNLLFEQLGDIRSETDIPLLLMGYLNPVMQFGMERFCAQCREVGIDGLIIPDLPADEYAGRYRELFVQAGLHHIFLITPQTPEPRIRMIEAHSGGFIYMVAAASTTGVKEKIADEQVRYFERIRSMNLSLPTLIGFGISNHETYTRACRYASGVIIGSAFIQALEKGQDVGEFIQSIRKG